MNDVCLTDHFLIAMPQLDDPNFFHSVTYICQHNAEGTMGVIINQPLNMSLADILEQLEINSDDKTLAQQPVYFGGPVQQDRGFILHSPSKNWQGSLFISDDIALTTSRDILTDIANQDGPTKRLVALGYAGWGAGQLEYELAKNAWLSVPASAEIIFDTPIEKRWHAAASLLGVNLQLLSDEIGHA
jgi:putative transcriptional regulator